MIIKDQFDVDAPLDTVWALLKDIPRVASCIPNAKITETIDDRNYVAEVGIKVGPVAVAYKAAIVIESLDDATHTAKISVKGTEMKGRGGVNANVTSSAEQQGAKTHVTLETDAAISGIIATVGGRLIEGVAKATTAKFASNLEKLTRE